MESLPASAECAEAAYLASAWEKCARQLTLNSLKTLQDFFDISCQILNNIIEHPDEAKFRTVKLSNKAIAARVVSVRGGLDFLCACGFTRITTPTRESAIALLDPSIDAELPHDIEWLRHETYICLRLIQ